jgi:hypothetical protein
MNHVCTWSCNHKNNIQFKLYDPSFTILYGPLFKLKVTKFVNILENKLKDSFNLLK